MPRFQYILLSTHKLRASKDEALRFSAPILGDEQLLMGARCLAEADASDAVELSLAVRKYAHTQREELTVAGGKQTKKHGGATSGGISTHRGFRSSSGPAPGAPPFGLGGSVYHSIPAAASDQGPFSRQRHMKEGQGRKRVSVLLATQPPKRCQAGPSAPLVAPSF